MIEGKWIKPGEDLSQALPIREAVMNASRDSLDEMAWNAFVCLQGRPAAAGRIWWAEGAFWIGNVCVLPEARGQGLGDLMVRLLLFKAREHGARRVCLTAPSGLVSFFARYGFREKESLAGGEARLMELPGGEISLGGCGKGYSA